MTFEAGKMLTRKEIADALGGIGVGILPVHEGKVACGLFDPAVNAVTHLGGEIDVYPAKLPKRLPQDAIPVFLKAGPLWRYVGAFKLETVESEKRALEKGAKEIGAATIGAILRFVPTKPALTLVTGKGR